MMQGLRNAGQSWIGRIVVGILFALLILSFGVWGIGDAFRGGGRSTVATVGSREVTAEAVRSAYQSELQNLQRRLRRSVPADLARQLGLEQGVLQRLVAEAALDQRVDDLGLAVSDETIVRALFADPSFRGSDGNFDRRQFDEALRSNGLSEQAFLREQSRNTLRQQLAEAMTGGIGAPTAMLEALYRQRNETRSVDYVVLEADKVEAPPIDPAALSAFFQERRAEFRAPESRSAVLLSLTPDAIAKPDEVSDDDLRAEYERVKAQRFGSPERRRVQQLVFPNADEARAALERIRAGAAFEAVAAERGAKEADLDLGKLARTEFADPAVAAAAFALPAADTVSEPVAGRFGTVLVRVAEIEAENIRSLTEVSGELRTGIARARASVRLRELHDRIEDQRASAKPLPEIAASLGLAVRTVDGLDATGSTKDGPLDVPERDGLVRALFASDIGVDNEAVQTRDGGYIWFEVTNVQAARDRELAEVQGEVERRWREEQVARRLEETARRMLETVRGGKSLADVAQESGGLAVKQAAGLKRDQASGDISASAAALIFATPFGGADTARSTSGLDRLVFLVTGASVPPFVSTSIEAAQVGEQLRPALAQDVVAQYVQQAQVALGVRVNEAALRAAIGGTE